jgi:cytochrome c peroxidase
MRRSMIVCLFLLPATAADFQWRLPKGIPEPAVPSDNPMSATKVELGRHLFYDSRMSVNQKQSCASCHRQDLAFTDGKARAEGTTGEIHPRGSMSLANVAYTPLLTWANPAVQTLEEQALLPMFGIKPVELGMRGREAEFLAVIRGDKLYRGLFPPAFPDEADPYNIQNVVKAIAVFERSIVSMRSPYDRYRYGGENGALSDMAKTRIGIVLRPARLRE